MPAPRRKISGSLMQRLHGVAKSGKFAGMSPADLHAELHRASCYFFGQDHLTDLSEGQGYLLYRWLRGERKLDPSPKRQEKLAELEALLAPGGDDLRSHVLAVAEEKFGAEGLDDCGIKRLGALIVVAQRFGRRL